MGAPMKKQELAKRLARESGLSQAAAADKLDRLVHNILRQLRQGKKVSLPGLGTFFPGPKPAFRFESEKPQPGRSRK
ncbi:MAG: HU family DNA-binding protein [Bryobacterales bacterium]|nr:HU family DNA-binding protein [Bryobacteraceae bacterium]MDW8130803.1 HU family DNA-binding protein [Bryobacterales bacterium]